MEAFGQGAGIWLPHSTYAMLSNPHLHRIPLSQARRGDLMFYGSGHVEFNTIWYHQTFGAHDSGSRVGWIAWGPYWYPTAAYRVY
jgi:cell wall-associated NlpC family hydrolase